MGCSEECKQGVPCVKCSEEKPTKPPKPTPVQDSTPLESWNVKVPSQIVLS